VATFLADKSALTRRDTRPEVRETLEPLLLAGEVATCGIVDLQSDVLVAACAERAGLTVLHYDADFERIAELTGQPVQWIVPRGSVA
jgi:predicted nuclease of predicted toxin-antitoxin system